MWGCPLGQGLVVGVGHEGEDPEHYRDDPGGHDRRLDGDQGEVVPVEVGQVEPACLLHRDDRQEEE